mgnify:CR=1 FL=1
MHFTRTAPSLRSVAQRGSAVWPSRHGTRVMVYHTRSTEENNAEGLQRVMPAEALRTWSG